MRVYRVISRESVIYSNIARRAADDFGQTKAAFGFSLGIIEEGGGSDRTPSHAEGEDMEKKRREREKTNEFA